MASKRAKPVREVHLEKESHNKETKPEAGSDIIAPLELGGGSPPVTLWLEKMDAGGVDNLVIFRVTALRPLPDLWKQLLNLLTLQQLLLLPLLKIRETTNS